MYGADSPARLAAGTRVITRVPVDGTGDELPRPVGAVAVIVAASPAGVDRYRVRFADGGEVEMRREDLAVRTHVQDEGAVRRAVVAEDDLYRYVAYRCVIGSRAYGLDGPGSDTDRRGFYLPPAVLHWSLAGVPDHLANDATQEMYWELQRFLTLALKSNPNVLECLYTPLVEYASPLARDLLAMRQVFLSQMLYQTYNGYVMTQFKRFQQSVRAHGTIKWKHAMHLIRLLLAGITALEDGVLSVDAGEHRDELLAIRRGEVPWRDVDARRLDLHRRFDQAFVRTRLPERPDGDRVNAFLLTARQSMV